VRIQLPQSFGQVFDFKYGAGEGNRTLVISLEDFSFEQEQNIYICPAGKVLATTGQLFNDGETLL
jgi:hypothetical protein